jgi:ribosomal protein L11 methylase PrmA
MRDEGRIQGKIALALGTSLMSFSRPDIGFIPTPQVAIEALLELAAVSTSDVVYDLGCGDGQILITAALKCPIQGIGIDIDPQRIHEAQEKARSFGVSDRIAFRQENLFQSTFTDATVVILYLLPHLNLKLRPALFRQLQPGTRIVSVDFDMGDWLPESVVKLDIEEETTLYFWRIPENK